MTKEAKIDLASVAEGAAAIKKESDDKKKASLADAYVEKPRLDPDAIGASLLERMPEPTGWRILILPYQGKAKTAGGIFLPSEVQEKSQISTQVGYVLKVGPL
ncbi:MAG: hypothetical protein ACPHIB_06940, partial [Thalassobaculaceae bacterium]